MALEILSERCCSYRICNELYYTEEWRHFIVLTVCKIHKKVRIVNHYKSNANLYSLEREEYLSDITLQLNLFL